MTSLLIYVIYVAFYKWRAVVILKHKSLFFWLIFFYIDLNHVVDFSMGYFFSISISLWLLWLREGCRLFIFIVISVFITLRVIINWFTVQLHSFLCIEEPAAGKASIVSYKLNIVISLLSTGPSRVAVCTLSLQKIIVYWYRAIKFSCSISQIWLLNCMCKWVNTDK